MSQPQCVGIRGRFAVRGTHVCTVQMCHLRCAFAKGGPACLCDDNVLVVRGAERLSPAWWEHNYTYILL